MKVHHAISQHDFCDLHQRTRIYRNKIYITSWPNILKYNYTLHNIASTSASASAFSLTFTSTRGRKKVMLLRLDGWNEVTKWKPHLCIIAWRLGDFFFLSLSLSISLSLSLSISLSLYLSLSLSRSLSHLSTQRDLLAHHDSFRNKIMYILHEGLRAMTLRDGRTDTHSPPPQTASVKSGSVWWLKIEKKKYGHRTTREPFWNAVYCY